jgi:hypothetical protein
VLIGGVRDRVTEALLKYEKAKVVLEVALSITEEKGRGEVGDFDYKTLVERLRERGYNFDPKMILRSLEKDYAVIETSYKSSNQHWWKFVDLEAVKETLGKEEEPEVMLIRAQAHSLNLDELERKLRFLAGRGLRTEADRTLFRKIAFSDLPLLVELHRRAVQYEETQYIVTKVMRILTLATKIAMMGNAKDDGKGHREDEGETENNNADGIRLLHGQDTF